DAFKSASQGDISAATASVASVLEVMGQFAGRRLANLDVQTLGRSWLDILRQIFVGGWPGLQAVLPGLAGLLALLAGLISLKALLVIFAIALIGLLVYVLIDAISRIPRKPAECNPPPDRIADPGALGANLEVGPDRDVPR